MSTSSSASGLSNSMTPTPQSDQSSVSQPGLVSWIRNALLPGSSVSRTNSDAQPDHDLASLPFLSVDDNDNYVDRRDHTKLTPRHDPFFPLRRAESDQKGHASMSNWSSDSNKVSNSTNAWSLEPLRMIERRPSATSAVGTAEDDEIGSSVSSDEDVYTPFTTNEEFVPPYINSDGQEDTQPMRFRGQAEHCAMIGGQIVPKQDESQEALRLASRPRLNLTIGQARNAQDIVKDDTPRHLTAPSVVLTPPDGSLDARPMSPTAGWTDEMLTPLEGFNTPIEEAFPSEERIKSFAGDGEHLEDSLGSPLSPEEVARHRPSKESVVLGSRGAHTRSMSMSKGEHISTGSFTDWDDAETKAPSSESPIPEGGTSYTTDSTLINTPVAPQPKRATGFFSRRRLSASQASTTDDAKGAARWRLGRKAQNASVTSVPEERRASSSPNKKMSPASSEASFKINSRSSTREAASRKEVAGSALGAKMQPFAIKVRSRNKSAKERDFARVYLAQELSLQASKVSTAPSSISSVEGTSNYQTRSSPAKPTLSHLDSVSSIASSANSAMMYRKRATWAMKFSLDGRYLAIAGQDAIIRVFAVLDNPQARRKVEMEAEMAEDDDDFLPSRGQCPFSTSPSISSSGKDSLGRSSNSSRADSIKTSTRLPNLAVFQPEPLREFKGHTSDILELSWSKGGFLLSASMDKTAKIWHMSWPNSLVSFIHGDFVTSAVFHPRDDRFLLSGSLDGKLRVWNVTSRKVEYSREVPGLITACAFTESGDTACVGTFAGHALFYSTEGLIYSSSIAVKSPSGKYAKGGRKITAIEPLSSGPPMAPSETGKKKSKRSESVLITSNDSRVRAYNLKDKSILARFKAKTYDNRTSQIRATVPEDKAYVVVGSEATCPEGGQVHIWDCSEIIPSDAKGSNGSQERKRSRSSIATADSAVEYFTAHAGTVTCAIMALLSTNILLSTSGDYISGQSEVKVKKTSVSSLNDNVNGAISPRLNRIIVSVDESAVVRVWRSDSLHTVEG